MGDHVDPYRLYSHDPGICPGSQPLDMRSLAPFYEPAEDVRVKLELERLFQAFRTKILFGQRHYAPSPSWRDELTTRASEVPTPPRFVVRVHLFEDRGDRAGKYLGFASLRPPGWESEPADRLAAVHAFQYVIDAELTAPAYMLRPRYHVLTTTTSSARLGVLPFRSAAYSAAGLSEMRGSTCMHLAVSQALHLIMGRFATQPISQIEFDWHLWRTANSQGKSIGEMGRRGASLSEALRVIRESCNGGGFQMTVEPRKNKRGKLSSQERELAARFLTDALACGLPVIAFVRSENLLLPEVVKHIKKKGNRQQIKALDDPHAVLVLGMHLLHSREEIGTEEDISWQERDDLAELPGRVILHDTLSRGPYFECLISDFLDAAAAAVKGKGKNPQVGSRGVHFLVVGPRELRLGHHQARDYAHHALKVLLLNLSPNQKEFSDADLKILAAYLDAGNVQREKATKAADWRLICRFLSTPEVVSRYKGMSNLEPCDDLLDQLKPGNYWVLEVRHPLARRHRRMNCVASPADLAPALVYIWNCNQEPPRNAKHEGCQPQCILRFNPAS